MSRLSLSFISATPEGADVNESARVLLISDCIYMEVVKLINQVNFYYFFNEFLLFTFESNLVVNLKRDVPHSKSSPCLSKSVGKNAWGKNALVKNAWGKNALVKNAWGKNALVKNALVKNAWGKNAWGKNALVKNAWEKNALVKNAWGKDASKDFRTNGTLHPQQPGGGFSRLWSSRLLQNSMGKRLLMMVISELPPIVRKLRVMRCPGV